MSSTNLFNVYINDLLEKIREKQKILNELTNKKLSLQINWYYRPQQLEVILIALYQALEALHEWSLENKMEINIDKTMFQYSTLKQQSIQMNKVKW